MGRQILGRIFPFHAFGLSRAPLRPRLFQIPITTACLGASNAVLCLRILQAIRASLFLLMRSAAHVCFSPEQAGHQDQSQPDGPCLCRYRCQSTSRYQLLSSSCHFSLSAGETVKLYPTMLRGSRRYIPFADFEVGDPCRDAASPNRPFVHRAAVPTVDLSLVSGQ